MISAGILKGVVITAAFGIIPAAQAASFILCTAPDHADVVLELETETFDGVALSCLSSDFVYDMTPCAPAGGYGLSAPTGSAALVEVVSNWQDYGDHSGGVVSFSASPSEYSFQGGFHYPGSGYQEAWTFTANRLSGEGVLSIVQEVEEGGEVGRSSTSFMCKKAEQRF